jgi:amino acid transporter
MTTTEETLPGVEPELDHDAIGFKDGLVIGLASTAPAYSLAAVLGTVVVVVGVAAPGALLASFVPMFLVATAFFYLNRADPDAGTTFSWVTRALGPWFGWIGGFAVCTTGILVVGSLAEVGARYTCELVGWEGAAGSKTAVVVLALVIIVVMTAICVLGTELSAHVQDVMIFGQIGALLLLAVAALWKVYAGDAPPGSSEPELSWLSPFDVEPFSALVSALLIGVFIYWGWESSVNLTEETRDSRRAPGLAAITSTVVLLVTYVGVATALIAYWGTERLAEFDDDDALFGAIAADVLGSPWDKLVVLAIVTSAIASTQTTIIPSSRTSMSMGRAKAVPHLFAVIHPRFHTPWLSTIVVAALAIAWYVPATLVSENFLFDSLSALSLAIAFYYALTGVACAIYFRHQLRASAKNLLLMGVAPLVGSAILGALLVRSAFDLADPDVSYSGGSVLGVGVPLVIAVGFTISGLVLMVLWRLSGRGAAYFARRPFESAPESGA